ncbi:MAG: DUF542 domain-containing protein [Pyrinomonadaceae bacterium]|nr:DUF542 domain-containing protein [Sphingobacteriaceae bacterium]
METIINQTIDMIVARDYKASAVFQKHGFDLCCMGEWTLKEVCEFKHLDAALIENEVLLLFAENKI